MRESMRKSGIEIVGDVPWGTHFCQFYQTKEDLLDIFVSYFKAGLENNEFCLWITSEAPDIEEAKEAMKRAVPDIDVYLEKGQIEIIPYINLSGKESSFDSGKFINSCIEKLDSSLINGYDGLRWGNSFWLEKSNWNDFVDCEEKIDRIFENCRIIVLCTYPLDSFKATEIIDVVINHRFALVKREGKWEQIESSKHKKSEEKIRNLANIVESSYDAIITKTLDGIITSWNKGAEQIYGYLAEEVMGKPISILEPPILIEETKELAEMIEQGDRIHHYETLRLRKDGKIINVSINLSPIFDTSKEPTAILVIARDITEIKKTEKELQKSEERYRIVTEQTGQVIYEYDLRTDKSSWAGAIEEVTGYSFEEFKELGKDIWVKNIYPTDLNQVEEKYRKVRQTGGRFKEELRFRKKDGTCIYVENSGVWLTDYEGQPYRALGVLKDITEKKLSSKELQENEERFRTATEQTGQIIFDFKFETHEVRWAGAIRDVTGYCQEEFENFDESSWIEHVHPEDLTELLENLNRFLKKEEKIQAEYRFRKKDGNYIYIEIRGVWLKDEEGNVYRAIGVMKDINKMKLSQEMLKRNEKKYRLVTERTGQLVYDFDLITDEVNWAGAVEETTGYTKDEFQDQRNFWVGNIHPADRDRVKREIMEARQIGERYRVEFRFRKKDGTYIYLENNGVYLKDESGSPVRSLGAVRDITERKTAEERLQESERKYRSFIQNFHGIAFQADEQFVPVFLHGAVEEITGYREEDFMSRIKWKNIIHPEDLHLIYAEEKKVQNSVESRYGEVDFRIIRRDGKIRWVHEICQKVQKGNEKPEFYQGTIFDVTERKETEKFLTSIEAARKKEIHHRIKNNLQVISSLLDLQAEKFNNRECIRDFEVLEAFRDSQDRVISMALIHEELYKGGGIDTLNFSSYVEKLVENLFLTYRLGNTDISLNMDLEENIFFDMDTAIPLGIIINELVSNSLKYAFTSRDNGKVQIKLCGEETRESKDNRAGNSSEELKGTGFMLIVSDNGVGIPETLDMKSPDSLGMQLVIALVDQLEGKLEMKRDKGTEFHIMFTVPYE